MDLSSKRVLVTGADGFIGSHLVEHLAREAASITALVQYNSFNSWGWLDEVDCGRDVQIKAGDIRDAHFCLELMRGEELVFHLAALIPIPYSYTAPDTSFDTTLRLTLNLYHPSP